MAWRPPELLKVGDTVRYPDHPEYGEGTVLTEVDCGEFGQRLTVNFKNRGNMTIITTTTPLKKTQAAN